MATLARHVERGGWVVNRASKQTNKQTEPVRKYWAKCLPWPPIRAACLFPEPAAAHWTETEKKRSFIFFLKIGHSADKKKISVGNQKKKFTTLIQLPKANIFSADVRETDVWHENYKRHHMALDFSTD
jgi:hypothetical protein